MNTNKLDAIEMAIKLKRKGLTTKKIVIKLKTFGYRNPKTLTPWSQNFVYRYVNDIKTNADIHAIVKLKAIEYRIEGHKIKEIHQLLKQDGFINIRTGKPYNLNKINKWLNGIKPRYLTEAKAKAKELADSGNNSKTISKKLVELGYINKQTGRPYTVCTILNWLNGSSLLA